MKNLKLPNGYTVHFSTSGLVLYNYKYEILKENDYSLIFYSIKLFQQDMFYIIKDYNYIFSLSSIPRKFNTK